MKFSLSSMICLTAASLRAAQTPCVTAADDVVVLNNEKVRFVFNLASGRFDISNKEEPVPPHLPKNESHHHP